MPGEVRAMTAGTDRESQLNTQWKGMKAATAFGYQVANFTRTQVTLPCWAEMTTRQQMNQTEHSGGEDDALHFNDKDLPALGSIPGTHADPSCFKKTVHVSQSGQVHMTSTCWMNQSWVLKKTSYSQSMYSSYLEINKEQLLMLVGNPYQYFITFTLIRKKRRQILCTAYVYFTFCPASNSCQMVIYLLQKTINFPTVTRKKQ